MERTEEERPLTPLTVIDPVSALVVGAEYGGLWFDPARPATEQNLPFEEREAIELTAELIDEIVTESRKPKSKKAPGKSKRTKTASKLAKPTKKAARKSRLAKKSTKSSKKPARTAPRKNRVEGRSAKAP